MGFSGLQAMLLVSGRQAMKFPPCPFYTHSPRTLVAENLPESDCPISADSSAVLFPVVVPDSENVSSSCCRSSSLGGTHSCPSCCSCLGSNMTKGKPLFFFLVCVFSQAMNKYNNGIRGFHISSKLPV